MNAIVAVLAVGAAAVIAYLIVKKLFGWQIDVLQWLSNPFSIGA